MIQQPQFRSLYFTAFLLCSSAAQPTSPRQENDSIDSATMAILVLVVVSALLFLGSFSLWIQNCCNSAAPYSRSRGLGSVTFVGGGGSRIRRTGSGQHSRSTGVDMAVIDSFPTIPYSAAKEMKIGVGSLDCAVCLSEFSGEELLRLLPSCDHVFHRHCIAAWLTNHATCPVCRARVVDNNNSNRRSNQIEIEGILVATEISNDSDLEQKIDVVDSASASEPRGDSERFRLKIPEVVKEEMVKAGLKKLQRSASCECLQVEGMSRWIGRSERWGSSVVPEDRLMVKGDGRGDKSHLLPL